MLGYKVVTNVPQVPVASRHLWFSRHSQWGSLTVVQGPLVMEGCCPHGYPRAPWTKEGTSQGSRLGDEISSLTTLPQQLAQWSHPAAGPGVSISGSRRRNRRNRHSSRTPCTRSQGQAESCTERQGSKVFSKL